MKFLQKLRDVSVPLCVVETADPAETISNAVGELNGTTDKTAVLQWSLPYGLEGVNPTGKDCQRQINPKGAIESSNPTQCLKILRDKLPEGSIVFFHNAQNFLKAPDVQQAVWFLRDEFTSRRCIWIGLCPSITLPECLKHDIIVISEPLPGVEEIKPIVEKVCRNVERDLGLKTSEDTKQRLFRSSMGLSGFGVQQAVSLAVTPKGISVEMVIERRRAFVGQTKGVEIRTDKTRFSDIKGYRSIVELLTQIIANQEFPISLVLWFDEIEKMYAGYGGDSSGVTDDQVGVWLTQFQDWLNADRFSGIVCVGPPGVSKSMLATSLRNECKCECVRIDAGGMKGSLVGESEEYARMAVKTIEALSGGGQILCIATANDLTNVPSSLLSRFVLGTYFYDLPNKDEAEAILGSKRVKYNVPETDLAPDVTNWTGREINQLCFLHKRLGVNLLTAAKRVACYHRSSAEELKVLREKANGKWLSASHEGLYSIPSIENGRKFVKTAE